MSTKNNKLPTLDDVIWDEADSDGLTLAPEQEINALSPEMLKKAEENAPQDFILPEPSAPSAADIQKETASKTARYLGEVGAGLAAGGLQGLTYNFGDELIEALPGVEKDVISNWIREQQKKSPYAYGAGYFGGAAAQNAIPGAVAGKAGSAINLLVNPGTQLVGKTASYFPSLAAGALDVAASSALASAGEADKDKLSAAMDSLSLKNQTLPQAMSAGLRTLVPITRAIGRSSAASDFNLGKTFTRETGLTPFSKEGIKQLEDIAQKKAGEVSAELQAPAKRMIEQSDEEIFDIAKDIVASAKKAKKKYGAEMESVMNEMAKNKDPVEIQSLAAEARKILTEKFDLADDPGAQKLLQKINTIATEIPSQEVAKTTIFRSLIDKDLGEARPGATTLKVKGQDIDQPLPSSGQIKSVEEASTEFPEIVKQARTVKEVLEIPAKLRTNVTASEIAEIVKAFEARLRVTADPKIASALREAREVFKSKLGTEAQRQAYDDARKMVAMSGRILDDSAEQFTTTGAKAAFLDELENLYKLKSAGQKQDVLDLSKLIDQTSESPRAQELISRAVAAGEKKALGTEILGMTPSSIKLNKNPEFLRKTAAQAYETEDLGLSGFSAGKSLEEAIKTTPQQTQETLLKRVQEIGELERLKKLKLNNPEIDTGINPKAAAVRYLMAKTVGAVESVPARLGAGIERISPFKPKIAGSPTGVSAGQLASTPPSTLADLSKTAITKGLKGIGIALREMAGGTDVVRRSNAFLISQDPKLRQEYMQLLEQDQLPTLDDIEFEE